MKQVTTEYLLSHPVTWDDIWPRAQKLMRLKKEALGDQAFVCWPAPGHSIQTELSAPEDRTTRFFLDIASGALGSSLTLETVGLSKSKTQCRANSDALVRIEIAEDPRVLKHRNPDGVLITGPHVHLCIDGMGARWAVPLNRQALIQLPEVCEPGDTLASIKDLCNIGESVCVKLALGI